MLADPGMVGRALQGVVEGHLHAVRPGPRRPGGRSRRWCRAPGRSRCARPRGSRWPTGCRGRPAGAVRVLFAALAGRGADRVDRAAGTARRSPWRPRPAPGRRSPASPRTTGGTARTRRRPGPAHGRPTAATGTAAVTSGAPIRTPEGGRHLGRDGRRRADRRRRAPDRVRASRAAATDRVGSRPAPPAAATPSAISTSTSWPACQLDQRPCGPRWRAGRSTPRPRTQYGPICRGTTVASHSSLPSGTRAHRLGSLGAALADQPDLAGQDVVAVLEHRGPDP